MFFFFGQSLKNAVSLKMIEREKKNKLIKKAKLTTQSKEGHLELRAIHSHSQLTW